MRRATGLLLSLIIAAATPAPAAAQPMTHLRLDASEDNVDLVSELRASIVGGNPDQIEIYLLPEDLWQLDAWGVPYTIVAEDYRDERPASTYEYHDSGEMEQALEDLAADYPDLVRVFDLGQSIEGRSIVGVILSADVRHRRAVPAQRLLGLHHGDEWSGMEVALDVARALADGYGVDADITALLDAEEVWVVPAVNPDGLEAYERYNAAGTDLNRNYDYEWDAWEWGAGPHAFSEPETLAVRANALRRSFYQSLSYHSGATVCNYLWNYTGSNSPDEDLLEYVCEIYDAANTTQGFWVTNGYAWYETHGDTNDWSYGVRGGLDYTLEVTSQKAPPESAIEEYLDDHLDASLQFLDAGRTMGVVGQVTDGLTGVPLEAKLTFQPGGWPVYADPDTGTYHRMLFSGSQELLVEAPGYESRTVPFTVPSGSTVTQDVALSRQVSAVVALRVTPSVLDIDGGPVLVTIEGSGLGSWAEAATLQRWDGDDLSLSMTPDGADDVAVQIDPDDLRPDYGREGLWWLTVEGDGGAVPLPRAVVVVGEGDASFQLSGVSVVDDAGGAGVHRLTVMGDAMPRGSDVLLIGPQGAVVWPAEVETESTTMINALFDGAALADGWWDVVLAGGAHWRALDDALYCDDGMFTDPGGDDDDDAADDDDVTGDDDTAGDDDTGDDDAGDDDADDPGDDDEPLQISGSGCQCGHAGEFPGTAILMIGALLGFVIRRR